MHPDLLLDLADQRVREHQARSRRRRIHQQRPRPPGPLRRGLAAGLVRLASWLADEPALRYRRA